MADDAARMRSDGSLVGRPARTGSGTTRGAGAGGGGGGLRHATGSAPHYLGNVPVVVYPIPNLSPKIVTSFCTEYRPAVLTF